MYKKVCNKIQSVNRTGLERSHLNYNMEYTEVPSTEKYSLSQKINYWLGLASFNGFNRLVESKPKIRLSWFVVIIIAYLCMCYHISKNIRQFFSYPVNTKMEFSKYHVRFPDLTICPIGIPKEYHNFDDKVVMGDAFYRLMFTWVNIDRKLYQYHYFNKINYFKNQNYTTGHIGSHLMICNYLGDNCDFRNFTHFRDPVFTDCFTFRPKDNYIPRQGNVLTLGLYANKSLMTHDADFIATVNEHYTLPDIVGKGFRIRRGGLTEITFKTTDIERLDRPTKRCTTNKKVKYLFTKTDGIFNYTKEDCFRKAVQKEMFKRMKCINPIMGITQEFKTAPNCLQFPLNLTKDAVRYAILSAKKMTDSRYGTRTVTKENLEEFKKVTVTGQTVLFKSMHKLLEKFNGFKAVIEDRVRKFEEIIGNCTLPCKRIKIESWSTYNGFTAEDVDRIIEFGLPDNQLTYNHRNLIEKCSKTDKNLNNKITEAMLGYLKTLRDDIPEKFMHQDKYEAEKMNITREFARHMAFLDVSVVNVPGDGMVEERSYEAFKLLSDLGGNIGLWVGFSVISIFELLELFLLLIGAARKRRRLRREAKENNSVSEKNIPLIEEISAV